VGHEKRCSTAPPGWDIPDAAAAPSPDIAARFAKALAAPCHEHARLQGIGHCISHLQLCALATLRPMILRQTRIGQHGLWQSAGGLCGLGPKGMRAGPRV